MRLIQAVKKYDDFHSIYIYRVVLGDIINLMMLHIYSGNLLQMIFSYKFKQWKNCNFWEWEYLTYTTILLVLIITLLQWATHALVLIHDFVHDLWMNDSCMKDSYTKRWWFQEAFTNFLGKGQPPGSIQSVHEIVVLISPSPQHSRWGLVLAKMCPEQWVTLTKHLGRFFFFLREMWSVNCSCIVCSCVALEQQAAGP